MTASDADQASDELALPDGIRSRRVDNGNGLSMHVLEAGAGQGRPVIVLLHGFPELAYSWRRIMMPLADAGFHVIAPDQRGYGRTTGSDNRYDADLAPFRPLNLVRDILGLVAAFGITSVATLVGHDYGSVVAAWSALIRPDIFRSVVLMSAPFGGPPALPFDTLRKGDRPAPVIPDINAALAALDPPRKHYQAYYATAGADADMRHGIHGLRDFLRAYYHFKSADWAGTRPHPLAGPTATELARLPTYYVMNLNDGMAETVAREMPSAELIAACRWLPDRELDVYAAEYRRTGFQGGLNWYRCRFVAAFNAELTLFSGRTIDVPAAFIAGSSDWGTYQRPGDFERMQSQVCTRMQDCHLIDGAGHWVQQEQSEKVASLLAAFAVRNIS
ncbi:MAG: alpha/beta fold hydrolase [Xanthobacteraceae bacterium]